MPSYKLYYFNAKGRAEVPRYIFAVAGVEYEDVRFADFDEWKSSYKHKSPFGVAPYLEVDGKTLGDSSAIIRFLGREFGMMGESSWEAAMIDQTLGVLNDVVEGMYKFMYRTKDETEKKEAKDKFDSEMVPKFFKYIENGLQSTSFLHCSKVSVADLGTFYLLQMLEPMGALESAPAKVKDFYSMIAGMKQIKEWLEKRPDTQN